LISAIGLVSFLDVAISINPEKPANALRWKKIVTASVLLAIAIISFIQFFLLTLYVYFPPEKTEYTSWLERHVPASVNFVIIDNPAARNAMDEIQLDLSQHKSTALSQADLEANPGQLKTWKNFVAFVDLSGGKEFAEWIANRIPASSIQPVYVPGQRLRGYVVSDVQINASMDISLSHGLQDLWNSPARNILLFCGVGIIALFINEKTTKGKTSNENDSHPQPQQ
jgi:hypothetical protein